MNQDKASISQVLLQRITGSKVLLSCAYVCVCVCLVVCLSVWPLVHRFFPIRVIRWQMLNLTKLGLNYNDVCIESEISRNNEKMQGFFHSFMYSPFFFKDNMSRSHRVRHPKITCFYHFGPAFS